MSMTQEEIEALMNETADISMPAASEESVPEEPTPEEEAVSPEENNDTNNTDEIVEDDNFDDILASIDGITDDEPETTEDNMDNILASIDGITDDEPETAEDEHKAVPEEVAAVLDEQINQGVYPLPVEKEHKVVNQLNEVAEDSEQKVTQIFDVLSLVLDENAKIEKNLKDLGEFVESQTALLEALTNKFPKVTALSENLQMAQKLQTVSSDTCNIINEENNQIFVAMELMQFNDINRQKIERVMSVIKKLTQYLNGIFEDDSDKPEIQIAKHISGDSSNTVDEDDLEALIADFGN